MANLTDRTNRTLDNTANASREDRLAATIDLAMAMWRRVVSPAAKERHLGRAQRAIAELQALNEDHAAAQSSVADFMATEGDPEA